MAKNIANESVRPVAVNSNITYDISSVSVRVQISGDSSVKYFTLNCISSSTMPNILKFSSIFCVSDSSVDVIVTFGQFMMPLQTKCRGMQTDVSPGHLKSQSPSFRNDLATVPSCVRGKWNNSVHTIRNAFRPGVLSPVYWNHTRTKIFAMNLQL